jgi:hypothetical protein
VRVLTAQVPITTKLPLAVDLLHTVKGGSGGQVPNLNGPFERARARGGGNPGLDALQRQLTATERSAVSAAFANPFAVAALLALAALASLALLPKSRRGGGVQLT